MLVAEYFSFLSLPCSELCGETFTRRYNLRGPSLFSTLLFPGKTAGLTTFPLSIQATNVLTGTRSPSRVRTKGATRRSLVRTTASGTSCFTWASGGITVVRLSSFLPELREDLFCLLRAGFVDPCQRDFVRLDALQRHREPFLLSHGFSTSAKLMISLPSLQTVASKYILLRPTLETLAHLPRCAQSWTSLRQPAPRGRLRDWLLRRSKPSLMFLFYFNQILNFRPSQPSGDSGSGAEGGTSGTEAGAIL